MLVLSRKKDQSIIITLQDGTKIKVLVSNLSKDVVRLAFDAPRKVKINREEVEQCQD